jgi:predicted permease
MATPCHTLMTVANSAKTEKLFFLLIIIFVVLIFINIALIFALWSEIFFSLRQNLSGKF